MKAKYYLVIIFFCAFSLAKAQDKIFKTDSSSILVKVLEVNDADVKYKKFSNINGPTYTIKITGITMIIYENGYKEIYSKGKIINNEDEDKDKEVYTTDYNKEKTEEIPNANDTLRFIEQYLGVKLETTTENEGGVIIKGDYNDILKPYAKGQMRYSLNNRIITYAGYAPISFTTTISKLRRNLTRVHNTSEFCKVIFELKRNNISKLLFWNGARTGFASYMCKADISAFNIAPNSIGRNLVLSGKINEAIASYATLARTSKNNKLIAEYAYALALKGIYDAALFNLDRIGSRGNDPDVNYFTAQVFALMGYDDLATEFWKPTDNNIPAWISSNATRLLKKYKCKLPMHKRTTGEGIKAAFKQANELAAYHSYLQSIALFHYITDSLPNEYLPYAGYSIPLEKIGAIEKSEKVIEKAISLVSNRPEDNEKRQFLMHRLEAVRAKKGQMPVSAPPEIHNKKPDATRPQMMAYAGGMVAPSLTNINLRFGYYIMDGTNGSFNCGMTNTPDGTSVNLGLSAYSCIHSFVYGIGLQYSSGGYSSVQYSLGFRMKDKKRKKHKREIKGDTTADLFLDVNQGLSSGSAITWNLSYGTSLYFGKRTKK